jgi:hypothetical protein
MAHGLFSDRQLRALRPREREYKVTEAAPRGEGRLMLKVHPSGLKEFYYRMRTAEADNLIRIGTYEQTPMTPTNSPAPSSPTPPTRRGANGAPTPAPSSAPSCAPPAAPAQFLRALVRVRPTRFPDHHPRPTDQLPPTAPTAWGQHLRGRAQHRPRTVMVHHPRPPAAPVQLLRAHARTLPTRPSPRVTDRRPTVPSPSSGADS